MSNLFGSFRPKKMSLHKFRNLFVIFFVAFSLAACQPPKPAKQSNKSVKIVKNSGSGIGGTGKIAKNSGSGIGGTGKVVNKSDSGFGGTGVVGTITEFGSIWVNGLEIEYDNNVKIESSLGQHDKLMVGQQVVVETTANKKQPWTNTIQIFYPLAGLVTEVKANQFKIDGHTVYFDDNTIIAEGVSIQAGIMLAINGYLNSDNSWQATLIKLNPEGKHIYQTTPKVAFSKGVKKLLIETNRKTLQQWDKAFDGLPINLISNPNAKNKAEKFLLKADINNGKITGYHLLNYYNATQNSKKDKTLEFKKP